MIVPFLIGVENDPIHYLWIFYKYMDFCLKNNYPIITQEAYFEKPSILKNKKPFVFNDIENGYNSLYEFNEPTDNNMVKLKKYPITKEEENYFFSDKKTRYDSYIELLKNRNKKLEEIIEKKIESIEKKEKKKIEAFITWLWFPSLEYVANKHNIKVISQEQTTFRKPTYNIYMGYCCLGNKYTTEIVSKEYKEFKKLKTNRIFTREELLALFLSTNNLKYINSLKQIPSYEFGIDFGMDKEVCADVYNEFNLKYILDKCNKLVKKESIIGRTHPARPSKIKYKYMDNSNNSIEWILKCKRIVSSVSNTGFEAMLYGKSSYILGDKMPFSTETINTLDYLDDSTIPLKYLNYIIFGYFSPLKLAFDKKYLLEKIKNKKNIIDLYNYNMNYILELYNINTDIFDKPYEERLKIILMKVHKYTAHEATSFIKDINSNSLLEENIQLKNELQDIKRSKGWKLIEKIRKIRNRRK